MYSQDKEETIIVNFFKDRIGTLLDVGANDGKSLSNSLALIELGWSGVMVEASPKAFERLKETHKNRINVYLFNYAMTTHDGECGFYESGAVKASRCSRDNISLMSIIESQWVKPWKRTSYDKIIVPCKTFNSFLAESPIKKFNFITIDIEGEDENLLKQIDLNGIGCELLCIEFASPEKVVSLNDLCKEKGYKQIFSTKCNLLFVKI